MPSNGCGVCGSTRCSGDIDRPDTIHRASGIDGVLVPFRCCSPLFELAQKLRNIGLVDRQPDLKVIVVEPISDLATTGIGCFQRNAEQSFADFDGFGAVVTDAAAVRRHGFRCRLDASVICSPPCSR